MPRIKRLVTSTNDAAPYVILSTVLLGSTFSLLLCSQTQLHPFYYLSLTGHISSSRISVWRVKGAVVCVSHGKSSDRRKKKSSIKQSWSLLSHNPTFSWRNWGKLRRVLFRIARLLTFRKDIFDIRNATGVSNAFSLYNKKVYVILIKYANRWLLL
jgi:hypothetical protein